MINEEEELFISIKVYNNVFVILFQNKRDAKFNVLSCATVNGNHKILSCINVAKYFSSHSSNGGKQINLI